MRIEPESPADFSAQTAEATRDAIIFSAAIAEDRLPSEAELAGQFDVSSATIRATHSAIPDAPTKRDDAVPGHRPTRLEDGTRTQAQAVFAARRNVRGIPKSPVRVHFPYPREYGGAE